MQLELYFHGDASKAPAEWRWSIFDDGRIISEDRGSYSTDNDDVASFVALGKALRWLSDTKPTIDTLKIAGSNERVIHELAQAQEASDYTRQLLHRCWELLAPMTLRWKAVVSIAHDTNANELTKGIDE